MGNCCGFQFQNLRRVPSPPTTMTATTNPPGNDGASSSVGPIVSNPNLRVYTYQELKMATKGFKTDLILGEGGFGKVYGGWIDGTTLAPSSSEADSGILVAVKRCKADSVQGVEEWKAEIEYLGNYEHQNLVKLIGYGREGKQFLLVYEYMPNRSLEKHLFTDGREPLPWSTRIKIAADAARGLGFLHSAKNTVIYRDFKTANILLDEEFNAKLSDFGLATPGPPADKSHVSTQAVGTLGYAAPEYLTSGLLYVHSDVYGFGVVLLELVTGRRAQDKRRPSKEQSLVEWFKRMLNDMPGLTKIVDPRMGEYPAEGFFELARLIKRCIEFNPHDRPDMSEVLTILEGMVPETSKASSSQSKAKPRSYQSYNPSTAGGGESSGSSSKDQLFGHTTSKF